MDSNHNDLNYVYNPRMTVDDGKYQKWYNNQTYQNNYPIAYDESYYNYDLNSNQSYKNDESYVNYTNQASDCKTDPRNFYGTNNNYVYNENFQNNYYSDTSCYYQDVNRIPESYESNFHYPMTNYVLSQEHYPTYPSDFNRNHTINKPISLQEANNQYPQGQSYSNTNYGNQNGVEQSYPSTKEQPYANYVNFNDRSSSWAENPQIYEKAHLRNSNNYYMDKEIYNRSYGNNLSNIDEKDSDARNKYDVPNQIRYHKTQQNNIK